MGYFLRDLSNPKQSKTTTRAQEIKELGAALIDAYNVAEQNKNLAEFKALESLAKDSKNFTELQDFEGAFRLLEEKKGDAKDVHELTSLQAMERLLDNNYNTLNYKNAATESLNATLSKLDSLGGINNATSSDVNDIIGNLQSLQQEVSSNMYLANDKAFNDQILNQLDLIEITHLLDTHDLDSEKDGWQFDIADYKTAEAYLKKGDYKKARTQLEQGQEKEYNQQWDNAGTILKNNTKRWVKTNNEIKRLVNSKNPDMEVYADHKGEGIFKYIDYVSEYAGKFTKRDLDTAMNEYSGTLNAVMNTEDITWDMTDEGKAIKDAYDSNGSVGLINHIKEQIGGDNIYEEQIRQYIHDAEIKWFPAGKLWYAESDKELLGLGADLFADIVLTSANLQSFSDEMYGGAKIYDDPSIMPNQDGSNTGNIFPGQ